MRILIISDVHVPYQIDLTPLWNFLKIYDPHRVIIAGDLLDFYKASKFLTHPHYGYTIKDELDQGRMFLELLRDKCPGAEVDYVCGNHDYRLEQFILRQTPELVGIPELTVPEMLKLTNFRVNWFPVKEFATSFVDNWVDIADDSGRVVHIGHFNKAAADSGMTVRGLMMKRGGSFIQGHTHRAGMIFRRNMDGTQDFGIENPCLYDYGQAPYTSDMNWMQGWTIITDGIPELIVLDPNTKYFSWGGKIYKN